MFFKKRRRKTQDRIEQEIQGNRKELHQAADKAADAAHRTNELLDSVTYMIFAASGGERRNNGKH